VHTVKAIYSLLRLISVLVPNERETPRVPGPENHQKNSEETSIEPRPDTFRPSVLGVVLTSDPSG
jgi:hypothetical protein